jgi:hypothetical protein
MLGLSSDGRVTKATLSNDFTVKGFIKVPEGFQVITPSGKTIAGGRSFSIGNAMLDEESVTDFNSFKEWQGKGSRAASGYQIIDLKQNPNAEVPESEGGFTQEDVDSLKPLPKTPTVTEFSKFFSSVISDLGLFTDPAKIRDDLEQLNFIYAHYLQEVQALVDNKQVPEKSAGQLLDTVYNAFSIYMNDALGRNFQRGKRARELFDGTATQLSNIRMRPSPGELPEDTGINIYFHGGYFFGENLPGSPMMESLGLSPSVSENTHVGDGNEPPSKSKLTQKEQKGETLEGAKVIKTVKNITKEFLALEPFLPESVTSNSEYKNYKLKIFKAIAALDKIEKQGYNKDVATDILDASLHSLDSLLRLFVKTIPNSELALLTKATMGKVIVDQAIVDRLIVSTSRETRRGKLLRSASTEHVQEVFFDHLRTLGLSDSQIKEKLKGLTYQKKEGKKPPKTIVIFDENTNFAKESMSESDKDAVAYVIANVFGFLVTTDLDTTFSLESFLKMPHVGTRVMAWRGSKENPETLTDEQVNVNLVNGSMKARDALKALTSVEKHSFFLKGNKVDYTIEEALYLDDDEDRLLAVKALIKRLQNNINTHQKGNQYEYNKNLFLRNSLAETIITDSQGNESVKKIPPDGSSVPPELLERNTRGVTYCKNFTDACYFSRASFGFNDGGYQVFLRHSDVLPEFFGHSTPHYLVSRFAIPLGVRFSDGNLSISNEIREIIEPLYVAKNGDFPEGMSENERIVNLVSFFAEEKSVIKLPMHVLAKIRFEALGFDELGAEVHIDDTSFSGSVHLKNPLQLSGMDNFADTLKSINKNGGEKAEFVKSILKNDFGIEDSDPRYKHIYDYLLSYAKGKVSTDGSRGSYTEAYVNVAVALTLGKTITYEKSDGLSTPDTLIVQGEGTTEYRILTNPRSTGGFGDAFVLTIKNGEVSQGSFFEQKYGQTKPPHLNSVANAFNMLKHVASNYRIPKKSGKNSIPLGAIIFTEGSKGTLSFTEGLDGTLSASNPVRRTGMESLGEKR